MAFLLCIGVCVVYPQETSVEVVTTAAPTTVKTMVFVWATLIAKVYIIVGAFFAAGTLMLL